MVLCRDIMWINGLRCVKESIGVQRVLSFQWMALMGSTKTQGRRLISGIGLTDGLLLVGVPAANKRLGRT